MHRAKPTLGIGMNIEFFASRVYQHHSLVVATMLDRQEELVRGTDGCNDRTDLTYRILKETKHIPCAASLGVLAPQ
jgi:hypothetical protein